MDMLFYFSVSFLILIFSGAHYADVRMARAQSGRK